jgi:polysaccharide deacetylase family protein (PEP-CTERM system associated)
MNSALPEGENVGTPLGEGPRPSGRGAGSRSHLLSVVVEDYFHVAPLKSVVQTEQWYRFERRVEANTKKALDLLEDHDIKATFFVLGSIADEMPELVREVAERGHEIASKGFIHRSIQKFSSPSEFRDDIVRSREALERAGGVAVHGFRIGHRWFSPEDLWALGILAEEGFAYDSSVRPLNRRYARQRWRLTPHRHGTSRGDIWEFPLTSWTVGGWSLPISGGNYFRQFPHWLMRRMVRSWIAAHDAPFLMYFHVWELDPEQPRIRAAPLYERVRQYRNLDKMFHIVQSYLEQYRFVGIADYLGLPRGAIRAGRDHFDRSPTIQVDESSVESDVAEPPRTQRQAISVVIPCFNEELILPYLANTLASVEKKLCSSYDLSFIFVDDGSTDATWEALQSTFGGRGNCTVTRHPSNRGVAAAIMTGIRNATDDIVCSIDCDCTYDPHQLQLLIPLLTEGVDMVTASPYHSDGVVRNVPSWRLFLSKTLSKFYRVVLDQKLATYTSCFRVYRRQPVVGLELTEGGFLGVAEMLGLLAIQGGTIVEHPAVLEVRLLGRSKMKTLRTIIGHLGLLLRLGVRRVGRMGSSGGPA